LPARLLIEIGARERAILVGNLKARRDYTDVRHCARLLVAVGTRRAR
jgi:hypothetical protein